MKKLKKYLLVLGAIVFITLLAFLYFTLLEGEKPQISLVPDFNLIKADEQFTLEVKDQKQGLRQVKIVLKQGETNKVLLEKILSKEKIFTTTFKIPPRIKAGDFELEITAIDYSWRNFGKGNIARVKKTYTYDPEPPRFTLLSRTHYLNQGGSGLILYNLNEPVQKTGLKIGEYFFPAYKYQDKFYCFFAWPYELGQEVVPELIAQDLAGNTSQTGFYYHLNLKKFPKDNINLPESFLNRKMPYFKKYFPQESDLLQLFLKVNRELRQENRQTLREIGLKTIAKPLFKGAFLRLPNSARRASFAERRTYYFKGKEIDKQTHLGLDLASIAQDKVPAANNGIVIFAGEIGIYGNVIILDHGMGVQSLYAHLSEINVTPQEKVKKGQVIGKTGATGLAGGDHLHFAMLISGVPVNPVEWFDLNWLKNNIYDRIQP